MWSQLGSLAAKGKWILFLVILHFYEFLCRIAMMACLAKEP